MRRAPTSFVLLAAALVAPACREVDQAAQAAPARHLVVICIDTLRADHVGANGYGRQTTPHVDRLARAGTRFANAYAHSSWTVPATASILTSLYPSGHGAGIAGEVRHLADDTPVLQIRDGVESLPMRLQSSGFGTGLFSANPYLYGRFQKGFDEVDVQWRSAEALTTSALAWLARQGGRRSFAYLQYMDLHQPIEPPPPFFELFAAAEGGPRGPEHGQWSYGNVASAVELEDPAFRRFRGHKLALYDGAIRYVDDQVGRLLAGLADLGLADETLVIVTADHGEEFWEHALVERELGGDPRGLWGIGHGHSLFEELLRVPLILHGPNVPTREEACPARHVDVLPTVLALLGLPAKAGVEGRNLAGPPGDSGESCPALPVVAESLAFGPESRAIVWRGHKLVERSDGATLLFDLRGDPGERENLATERPRLVEGLRGVLERELSGDHGGPAEAIELDEETRRQLRALGYLR